MKKEFEVHRLNEMGMSRASLIAKAFETCLNDVEGLCVDGDGRCLALVRTKLEEACFFAKKAMASHPGNQEPKP